mgnify:CR=1 FL=1
MSARSDARGEQTREALIRAALEIFGRDGFHAASTRAIAGAAGVNQALIGFHFGGKRGLYLATFQHVADAIAARMAPLVQSVLAEMEREADRPGRGAARLRRYLPLIGRVTDAMVEMFTSEESRPWARLILREQQDPGEAFEMSYRRSMGPVLSGLARLVGGALDRNPEEREVRLLVITIIGQALVFRAASAAVLRQLGSRRIGEEDVAAIQVLIRRNVAAMLSAARAHRATGRASQRQQGSAKLSHARERVE